MKTYVPKSPCKNCGTSLRFLSNAGCAECLRQSSRRYQEKNREALLEKKRQWAKSNPEKNRAQSSRWQAMNREAAFAQQALSRAKNPDHYQPKRRAYAAARRATLIRRTPPWVDLSAVAVIYRQCPIGMEVDHIVPLRGRRVSGLHVPWNLQYLPASENAKKGNRFDV